MSEKDLDIAIEKCERIMEFDTRTLENQESENGHIFEKVYDLLQFLRQFQFVEQMPSAQPDVPDTNVGYMISRQAAIDALHMHLMYRMGTDSNKKRLDEWINNLPSAQPEIIRCKDCKFGEQDEVGRWFCRSLGCQIGNEDGSGFCADAERRTNNANIDT